jgi:pimeloyl-ACP methyl ester carboxylesterase
MTGDSGFHGLDLLLFRSVTGWGYPVVGMPSPGWSATLVDGTIDGTTTPEVLARDLERVVAAGSRALGLADDAPVILLGLSRGAGLAVEAATSPALRRRLRGVVVLGLCPHEERLQRAGRVAQPYSDKPLLAGLPLEVIQSTEDRYLGAAAAREAFGPDTDLQRLHPIAATSHTFQGGRDALLVQLEQSLAEVSRQP